MEKKFSKIEIAAIKRTAQNVAQFVTKKEKLNKKIEELEMEKQSLQPMIDAFQGPIKEMTGGYTTEDLVQREVVHTGKMDSKTGKEIIQTRYVLKYPETVVPLTAEDVAGSDYDADRDSQEIPEEAMIPDEQTVAAAEKAENDPFWE